VPTASDVLKAHRLAAKKKLLRSYCHTQGYTVTTVRHHLSS
jgi:hypothetical protein